MQALVAGLCVMLPEDPWEFTIDKLTTLISDRPVSIEWYVRTYVLVVLSYVYLLFVRSIAINRDVANKIMSDQF